MTELGDAIRTARQNKKLSQQQLADHFGITKSAVNAWESGKAVPDQRKLAKLADVLELAPGVVAGMPNKPGEQPFEVVSERIHTAGDHGREVTTYPTTQVTQVAQSPGRPDIPLWASAAAGDEGAMVLVPDPIDYLRRSERMLTVRNPFAFNVLGNSMHPAINHGDQVVINPSIVARPGHDCVFIHEGPEGMLALVKQLVRPATDHWRVRQFNPAKDFDISRKKWARVHPIAEIRKAGV